MKLNIRLICAMIIDALTLIIMIGIYFYVLKENILILVFILGAVNFACFAYVDGNLRKGKNTSDE